MALDTYKEIGAIDEKILIDYTGKEVIIRDEQNRDILFGGILDFDAKDPEVCYLIKGSISRRFQIRNLEKIIVPLDS